MFAIAANNSPPTAVWTAAYTKTLVSTTHTYASVNIGTPQSDRSVLIFITHDSDTDPNNSTVTIGGVAATELASALWFGEWYLKAFIAQVPSGATADVVISSTNIRPFCASSLYVFAVYGLTAPNSVGYGKYSTSGDSSNLAITYANTITQPSGLNIAAAMRIGSTLGSITWASPWIEHGEHSMVLAPSDISPTTYVMTCSVAICANPTNGSEDAVVTGSVPSYDFFIQLSLA